MKAYLRSVRIAPKKAELIAKLVRGMSVPDAVSALEHTNKKGARILETLLRSAMANASHNDRQDAQLMVIKTIVINKAQTYHRGTPMARGRMRPMRKFLSHIEVTLGFPGDAIMGTESEEKSKNASQTGEKKVKRSGTRAKSTKGKSAKDTAASSSHSAASPSERHEGRAGKKSESSESSPSSK